MTERELREALRRTPVDPAARERARRVVQAAFRELAPPPRRARPRSRRVGAAVLAACAAAVLATAAATHAPTDALARWLRDTVGIDATAPRPLLGPLPADGRLLVTAGDSAWVVAPDGAKRRLGRYAGASWSPRGLFVVAWQGGELTALKPDGDVRWSLRGADAISSARWAPGDGYRIAYVAGSTLWIVNGDGTGDRHLAQVRAAVVPAWRPGPGHVIAYADARGHVSVADVDDGRRLWTSAPMPDVHGLAWAPDAARLIVLTARGAVLLNGDGSPGGALPLPAGTRASSVAWMPGGEVALVLRDAAANRSELLLLGPGGRERELFTAPGRLGPATWSPDGRALLLPWPDADEWLFLAPDRRGRPVEAVEDVAAQFAPGTTRTRFPSSVEWAPPARP
jgi:hypothetical protein